MTPLENALLKRAIDRSPQGSNHDIDESLLINTSISTKEEARQAIESLIHKNYLVSKQYEKHMGHEVTTYTVTEKGYAVQR